MRLLAYHSKRLAARSYVFPDNPIADVETVGTFSNTTMNISTLTKQVKKTLAGVQVLGIRSVEYAGGCEIRCSSAEQADDCYTRLTAAGLQTRILGHYKNLGFWVVAAALPGTTPPPDGAIGFYGPDPGWSKSPVFVLNGKGDQMAILAGPSRMPLELDRCEWMSVDEMASSTLALLDGNLDETAVDKLRGRIRPLADATRLHNDVIAAVRRHDADLTRREQPPTGDDYNAVIAIVTAAKSVVGVRP